MRTFGLLLIVAGMLAFFYCSSRMSSEAPVPEGATVRESLEYPGGRLDLGRYAGLATAGAGALLAFFPRGR